MVNWYDLGGVKQLVRGSGESEVPHLHMDRYQAQRGEEVLCVCVWREEVLCVCVCGGRRYCVCVCVCVCVEGGGTVCVCVWKEEVLCVLYSPRFCRNKLLMHIVALPNRY